MTYDVVVCTRNRPDALSLSLPRILGQEPAPTRLVVVDSSDEPGPTAQVVERTAREAGTTVDVRVLRSRRGLTIQRNAGLEHVGAPIVFFPDDDSIWFDGYAAAKLEVYERDRDGTVGGVSGIETVERPEAFDGARLYRMDRAQRARQRIAQRRTRLEKRAFPDPFVIAGRRLQAEHRRPAWFGDQDVHVVEWMTGFRMSFRTEVIRGIGFDEALADYGLFEDVDVSFAVAARRLVVGAHRARVHHYQAPGVRGDGRALGATQVLNRAYIVCKHTPTGGLARQRLVRHALYKCAQYATAPGTAWGRARLAGAAAAARRVPELAAASPAELTATYRRVLREVLGP